MNLNLTVGRSDPRRLWRGLGLALALSGAALASPASDLFGQGYALLQEHYDGPSTADRSALRAQYAAELAQRCADQPACPLETGRAVLGDLLAQLHDPHTSVRDPEAAARLREALADGEVTRTGLRVAERPEGSGGGLLVTFVAPGSPAERAGLRRFERIEAVNGQVLGAADLATAERRGEPLALRVLGAAGERTVSVTPTRLRVNDLPILTRMGDSAVIIIPTFLASGTASTFLRLLDEARAAGARRLVVDLRSDGGGNLDECLAAASAFRPVTYRSVGEEGTFTAHAEGGRLVRRAAPTPPASRWDGPLAVLVNEGTASCAEVFTWALTSGALTSGAPGTRAITVGETTKGALNSAVDFYDLPGGNLLSVSISQAEDAGGHLLPTRIVPQVAAPQEPGAGQDPALQAALGALTPAGSAP